MLINVVGTAVRATPYAKVLSVTLYLTICSSFGYEKFKWRFLIAIWALMFCNGSFSLPVSLEHHSHDIETNAMVVLVVLRYVLCTDVLFNLFWDSTDCSTIGDARTPDSLYLNQDQLILSTRSTSYRTYCQTTTTTETLLRYALLSYKWLTLKTFEIQHLKASYTSIITLYN